MSETATGNGGIGNGTAAGSTTKAPGVRARVRAELTAEIKAAARRQLVDEGAGGLSLRAIARELDMASSAIYRYFASRDELLTALIIDAYNSAGELVEQADAEHPRDDHRGRFVAMALALRRWAVVNPHEYALIYGSPVPGYAAPQDTIDPATRIPIALLTAIIESRVDLGLPAGSGESAGAPVEDLAEEEALGRALADLMEYTGHVVPPSTVASAVEAWAELFGLISLELFGHFHKAVTDPEAVYDRAVRSMAERIIG